MVCRARLVTSSRTSRRLLDAWGGSARRVWSGEERAVLCRVGMRNVLAGGRGRSSRRGEGDVGEFLIVVRLGRSGVM